jgi:ectoine hydroxylase-related dioxygenase (phytanoyl-CoA dioxygenase family)
MQAVTEIQTPKSRDVYAEASELPLNTRFELGREISEVQRAFLDLHGFLLFSRVAKADEVARILSEIDAIQQRWLAEGRREVFGIPLFKGAGANGEPFIQRFPFTSCFSDYIRDFVRDDRFVPIRSLVGENTRVGDREKDGVVLNRYINRPGSVHARLGWHTDGLRDLFYLRMPKPMLNVGLHFDRVREKDGGLRLIPGTQNQGFWSTCFEKAYFISHAPDPREHAVETEPGDLTVHDGRLWHRVQASPEVGEKSLRRSMYVPYLTDEFQPKSDASKTPLYHRLGALMRQLRVRGRAR